MDLKFLGSFPFLYVIIGFDTFVLCTGKFSAELHIQLIIKTLDN